MHHTRHRFAVLSIASLSLYVTACTTSAPTPSALSSRYGFLALLGRDTVSVERVVRTADTLVSDGVDRFPRVRRRHTRVTLGPDGGIRHLEMDIQTPGEPANQRVRRVVADVTNDSVKIEKRDSSGVVNRAFATGGGITMAHLPQMYSLIDLYFEAALKRAVTTRLNAGDSVRLRQFYIDREFDRFPLHEGFVRPMPGGTAELWHDWLAGIGDATFDSTHHMLTYSGVRSTDKVDVKRLAVEPDVDAVFARFAAFVTKQGGKVELSVRDTVLASVGIANFVIDYSRPLARGRVLLGNLVPFDEVWRTGANAATQFSTSVPITVGGLKLAAGKYTLWTLPHAHGVELIVNSEAGQWGTGYNGTRDVGRRTMATAVTSTAAEKFTITIVSTDAHHGMLVMEWGTFRWTATIVILSALLHDPPHHRIQESGVLHLLPRLIAPRDIFRGIGIVFVARRVVIPRHRRDLVAGHQIQRLRKHVIRLPIEIVMRHIENHF